MARRIIIFVECIFVSLPCLARSPEKLFFSLLCSFWHEINVRNAKTFITVFLSSPRIIGFWCMQKFLCNPSTLSFFLDFEPFLFLFFFCVRFWFWHEIWFHSFHGFKFTLTIFFLDGGKFHNWIRSFFFRRGSKTAWLVWQIKKGFRNALYRLKKFFMNIKQIIDKEMKLTWPAFHLYTNIQSWSIQLFPTSVSLSFLPSNCKRKFIALRKK